jgi:hypothetical protein
VEASSSFFLHLGFLGILLFNVVLNAPILRAAFSTCLLRRTPLVPLGRCLRWLIW